MIITRTPFRISFVGGGSDLKEFYSQFPGAVLSTTINKYMYISSHRFFEPEKTRAKYAITETVDTIDDLKHPIIREALRKFNLPGGYEFSSIADIPAGTGMGSSSAFTVGMFHNLYAITGNYVSKEQLAEDACQLEIDILKEPIGKQDQYAASFGGLNIIRFRQDGKVIVEPLHIKQEIYERLENNLVLFYIGNARKASDILSEQKKNINQKEKFEIQRQMVLLVDELKVALYNQRIDDFGKLLHENWVLKQKLASKISNPEINEIYNTALKNGATGGKLLGAGGGGFMLFYCEKERQQQLIDKIKARHFEFKFDTEGTKLIYFADEK